MSGNGRTQRARWGGALLVALAPLPWLGLGTAAAVGPTDTPGNKGTMKVHEQGTPTGFEDNDPKVCIFNVEGFSFDEGQTGYLMIDGQGQSTGSYGPMSFGPTDVNGFYGTAYVNEGDLTVPDGHYKATLYGKQLPGGQQDEVKAKSKVFTVVCEQTPPKPTATETKTTKPPKPIETGSSQPGEKPSASVKATRLTQPATLPQTGSGTPVGGALAVSLLLIAVGTLLLLGPGQLASHQYGRKH